MIAERKFTVLVKSRSFATPTKLLFGTPQELVRLLHDGFIRTGDALGHDIDEVRACAGTNNREFIAGSMRCIVLITGVLPLWYAVDPRCCNEQRDYDCLFLVYMQAVKFLEFVGDEARDTMDQFMAFQ